MKITFKKEQGSVLFATLFATGIICMYLGSYLWLVRSENQLTNRSKTWNTAIPVAEAGIEEAFTFLKLKGENWSDYGTDTWVTNGNYCMKTNWLNPNEYYIVGILKPAPSNSPVIVSQGFARPGLQTNFISRTVQVNTGQQALFADGMVADKSVDLRGNNITIDSFDSSDPNYSSNGLYVVSKRKDNGVIASNSTLSNSMSIGNANIWGKIATGPGVTLPAIGARGIVGDTAFHSSSANNGKIQDGAWRDDMNVNMDVVPWPGSTPISLSKSSTNINGTNYDFVITGTSTSTPTDYRIENPQKFTGNVLIKGPGKVRLLVTSDVFQFTSTDLIQLENGASVELYVASPTATIGGGGLQNATGKAENFSYFGLESNTALTFSGNGGFNGCIWAPNAEFTLGGGGASVQDFAGASVTKNVTINGKFNFHFDEALKTRGPIRGYIGTAWNELTLSWTDILAGNLMAEDLY